jgi:ribosomal protein L32
MEELEGMKKVKDKAPKVCPNCGKPIRKITVNREFGSYSSKCPWCKTVIETEKE